MLRRTIPFSYFLIASFIILGLYVPAMNFIALFTAMYMILVASKNSLVCITVFILPFATVFKLTIPGFSFFNIILICVLLRVIMLNYYKLSAKSWIVLLLFGCFTVLTSLKADIIACVTVVCSFAFVVCLIDQNNDEIILEDIVFFASLGVIITSIVAKLNVDVFPRLRPLMEETATIRIEAGEYFSRFSGLMGNPNHYSFLVSVLLAVYCVIIIRNKANLLDLIIFITLSVFGFMSISLSFIFAYIFMILLILCSTFKRDVKDFVKYFMLFGFGLLLCLMFLSKDTFDVIKFRFARIFNENIELSSATSGRSDLWLYYIKHLLTNIPTMILGSGIGSDNLPIGASHNFYIDILYHLGIIGGIFFIACISVIFKPNPFANKKSKFFNYIPILIFLFRAFSINLIHAEQLPFCLLICALTINWYDRGSIKE